MNPPEWFINGLTIRVAAYGGLSFSSGWDTADLDRADVEVLRDLLTEWLEEAE